MVPQRAGENHHCHGAVRDHRGLGRRQSANGVCVPAWILPCIPMPPSNSSASAIVRLEAACAASHQSDSEVGVMLANTDAASSIQLSI